MVTIISVYDFNKYKKNLNNDIIKLLKADKRNYFLLDDEDKYNYETVKTIFQMFSSDYDFLKDVYNDISYYVEEEWTFEFLLRIYDIAKSLEDVKVEKYLNNPNLLITDRRKGELNRFKFNIELKKIRYLEAVDKVLASSKNSELGMGFCLLKSYFSSNEVILDFIARELLSKMFLTLDIERYLHTNYKSYDEIEGKEKAIIINIIMTKDANLGNYVINHKDLLKELLDVFIYIKENWHMYIDNNINETYEMIGLSFKEYIESHKKEYSNLDEQIKFIEKSYLAFYFAANKYGILEEMVKCTYGIDPSYIDKLKDIFNKDETISSSDECLYFMELIDSRLNKIIDINKRKEFKLKNTLGV